MTQILNFTAYDIEHGLRMAETMRAATRKAALGEPAGAAGPSRFRRRVAALRQPMEIQRLLEARYATFTPAA